MKHAIKTILVAALLAMSPSASAVDILETAGGIALMSASGAYVAKEVNDANDAANRCRATGGCSADRDDHLNNGPVVIGGLGILGGLFLTFRGLIDADNGAKTEPDYFTRNGLVLDGMTFGYTDTGRVGLQKKWEF